MAGSKHFEQARALRKMQALLDCLSAQSEDLLGGHPFTHCAARTHVSAETLHHSGTIPASKLSHCR